jgi:hypothetical protein
MKIEDLVIEVNEGHPPGDSGVVDDDVEPAKGIDRVLDDLPRRRDGRDIGVVRLSLATRGTNLFCDGLGHRLVATPSTDRAPDVVDEHRRAVGGES